MSSLLRHGLTSQGNVAMKEASLEDKAQYAGTAHPLLLPSCHRAERQVHHLLRPKLMLNIPIQIHVSFKK